jgi:hypothetical protein
MRSKLGWILAILFGLIILLAIPAFFLFSHGWFGGYGGMMGGYGRMMGRGFPYGFTPYSWVFIISSWLIRLGIFALLVIAGVWLVTYLMRGKERTAGSNLPASTTTPPPAPAPTCPNCHREVQADWKVCPYCETRLI